MIEYENGFAIINIRNWEAPFLFGNIQSLKLTEIAVDDFARAKQPATVGRGLPRADWIPLLRHFVAAA